MSSSLLSSSFVGQSPGHSFNDVLQRPTLVPEQMHIKGQSNELTSIGPIFFTYVITVTAVTEKTYKSDTPITA